MIIVELEQLDLPLQRKLKHSGGMDIIQKLLKMLSEMLKEWDLVATHYKQGTQRKRFSMV